MAALTTRQSKMTKEERDLQERILNKYRREGLIPTMIKIKSETGAAMGTIAAFMTGNSANEPIRAYIKDRLTKNLEPLPDDVVTLFTVWEKDKPDQD